MPGPLAHLTVVDLSRVLAGPWCTQLLADLGAEVIKIEKPGGGDDTRRWGPPFLKDANGRDTAEAADYLGCNRGKQSVAVDFTSTDGRRSRKILDCFNALRFRIRDNRVRDIDTADGVSFALDSQSHWEPNGSHADKSNVHHVLLCQPGLDVAVYSIAFAISSTTFFASPNTIIVLSM